MRTRIVIAVVAVAILPLCAVGIVLAALGAIPAGSQIGRVVVFAIAVSGLFGLLVGYLLVADLARPLRTITRVVERVARGDLAARIEVSGDDEVARLAESHNRLAGDLERRNRELRAILQAVESTSARDGVDQLTARAAADARLAFGLIDATVVLGDPATVPVEEIVPGDPLPVRAELRSGGEAIGIVAGHLPATRRWERGDQDLLDLFALEIGVAVRNAELFGQVERQNEQLVELDAAKDDFLRGVSHNLQTPLARIRANAEALAVAAGTDRRLAMIVEQSDRLSRMVRQLLTVSRLESGALHPRADVLALAPRIRRAWEALDSGTVDFRLEDRAEGWLAVADPDQLDQVLWALLDNAVKYGGGTPVEVTIAADEVAGRVGLTIADHGVGVATADRDRLFARFERGSGGSSEDGSGLGLYVSRELCRAMNGELLLEPVATARGAAFTILLPGEPGRE
ncbi:MAG TPA: ATP-binding protein [Candidatus Limnocylindrales bacterium]